ESEAFCRSGYLTIFPLGETKSYVALYTLYVTGEMINI
ncbi:hypothetical protein SAMN05216389_1271, partial [Oceanobacillus limi]